MNAEQIAAAVAAGVQQVLAAQQQQQQQQQQQPPAVAPFARSPALANAGAVIDYSTPTGTKLYKAATAPLATTFSLDEPNIRVFLFELTARANEFGWSEVLNIDIGTANNPDNVNLLTQHGRVTAAKCRTTAETYINGNTRRSQNNYQLYKCLTESVDAETKKTMANEFDDYTVTVQNNAYQCGATYLKVLLAKAEVDTRAMAAHVRMNLIKLPEYMKTLAKDDIKVFNDYVKEQLKILTSRGETTTDLIANLFNAYRACGDKKFVKYIDDLKDRYDEGEDMSPEHLMTKALVKYQTLNLESEWNAPTEEERDIIAMRAQITELRAELSGKSTKTKKKPKEDKTDKRTPAKAKSFKGKWAWRHVSPKDGEPHAKTFEGEQWQFCEHHGYWCKHATEACEKNKQQQSQESKDITAAMADVGIEDVEEDDDDSME